MSNDTKPPFERRDDIEDEFLSPPGQPGSMMDRLAAAQGYLPGLEPRDVEIQLEFFARVVIRKRARRDD